MFYFAKRHGLSSQRPRVAHRPDITNVIRRYERFFLRSLSSLISKYPRWLIINMDETMIRQVQPPKRMWGMKGVGVRRVNARANEKNGITACISVSSYGLHGIADVLH